MRKALQILQQFHPRSVWKGRTILEANFCSDACVPSFPRTQVSLVEVAWVVLKFSASLLPFR